MTALYLAVALPGALVWLSSQSLVAVLATVPAAAVAMWSQIDIRRTLGVPLWPPWPSSSETLNAIRGRDTFYPNDPLQSAPERPTD